MDFMDIDQVLDVPDTPDRYVDNNNKDRVLLEKETTSSPSGTEKAGFSAEGVTDVPREKIKLVTHSRNIRRSSLSSRNSISENSEGRSSSGSALGNSYCSGNAHIFRRVVGEKAQRVENKNMQHKGKGKASSISQSSSSQEDKAFKNLTKQNGYTPMFEKAFQPGALEISLAEINKKSSSSNGFSSSPSIINSPRLSSNALKGKGKIDDTCKGGLSFDRGKGSDRPVDPQRKAGTLLSASPTSMSSPRVIGQKRLVRNGCISPHNIAKVKESSEKHSNVSVDSEQYDTVTKVSNRPENLDVRDLIAEDSNYRLKGKEVFVYPSQSEDPANKIIDVSSRRLPIQNEKANRISDLSGDVRCFEGLDGWRSTQNRSKKFTVPSSAEDRHLSMLKDDPLVIHEHGWNRMHRRDNRNESSKTRGDGNARYEEAVSHRHLPTPEVQTMCKLIPQTVQLNEPHHVPDTLIKKQKQGCTWENRGECSASAPDNSEIIVLGSPGEPFNPKPTSHQRSRNLGTSHEVIEVDEFSPGTRPRVTRDAGSRCNDESDAMARQLEADEMLARELQEQLYNEVVPGVGAGEIDGQIALSLLHDEDSQHTFSGGRHNIFHPQRSSLASNLYRQSLSRSSHNPSTRRGTQARAPTPTRMTRLRSRPPSQPRRLSSRAPLFPSNMDVDMRIHILEALEAFSDMGVAGNLFEAQRDFNENDYEMLLALDENNHQVGASLPQIDGLPQSTVQNDNFEEACAICLETPAMGDTIRHLPCLHKFHKDCIDPWLRRKTSCPVCKSSIT